MSVTVNYEADEKQKSEDTVNGGTPRRACLPGGGRTVWGAGRPGGAGAPQVRDAPRGNWMEEARPTHLENSEGLCTAEGGPGNRPALAGNDVSVLVLPLCQTRPDGRGDEGGLCRQQRQLCTSCSLPANLKPL